MFVGVISREKGVTLHRHGGASNTIELPEYTLFHGRPRRVEHQTP